jgi:hypothetical protein
MPRRLDVEVPPRHACGNSRAARRVRGPNRTAAIALDRAEAPRPSADVQAAASPRGAT